MIFRTRVPFCNRITTQKPGLFCLQYNQIRHTFLAMQTLLILITICLLSISIVQSEESLQCFATSALESQKDGVIICPEGSNNVCIKEVINTTSRADCGSVTGPYFGRDVWDRKLAQCVYRKCASRCPTLEEDRTRTFGGDEDDLGQAEASSKLQPTPIFNRTSYCCNTDICNVGERRGGSGLIVLLAMVMYMLL